MLAEWVTRRGGAAIGATISARLGWQSLLPSTDSSADSKRFTSSRDVAVNVANLYIDLWTRKRRRKRGERSAKTMQPLFVSWDARRGFPKLILLPTALLCARWQKISTSSFSAHYATEMRTFLGIPTNIFRCNRERYSSILVELHPNRDQHWSTVKELFFFINRWHCYFVNNFQSFDRLGRIVLAYLAEKLI